MKTVPAPPKSWPAGVTYITEPVFSSLLTQEQLQHIQSSVAPAPSLDSVLDSPKPHKHNNETAQPPPPPVKIIVVTDKSHPAYGQSALVAAKHLAPDSHIIDYIGFVHDERDVDRTSDYDISLDRERGVAVDACKMGNEARFINDYRGVCADGANAEFRHRWAPVLRVDRGKRTTIWEKRMAVYVLGTGKSRTKKRKKGIAKDQEILVSYGKGFWDGRKYEPNPPDDGQAAPPKEEEAEEEGV